MNRIDVLEQQAVEAAVKSHWKEAIKLNKQIVVQDKQNLSAHLRLGFSYLQLRSLEEAKKYYRKALKLQPANMVAFENLERIKVLESKSIKKSKKTSSFQLDPVLFLEMPGKTKSVALVNLGQKNILVHLEIGQEVILSIKKRKVEVRTRNAEYVGTLPDDLSRRLLLFLKAKSLYKAYIKEAHLSRVTVFIKEEKKGRTVNAYLSFPSDIQANINRIHAEQHENAEEENTEEYAEHDLEKLAETLTSEEKEYLPYAPQEPEDEETEE